MEKKEYKKQLDNRWYKRYNQVLTILNNNNNFSMRQNYNSEYSWFNANMNPKNFNLLNKDKQNKMKILQKLYNQKVTNLIIFNSPQKCNIKQVKLENLHEKEKINENEKISEKETKNTMILRKRKLKKYNEDEKDEKKYNEDKQNKNKNLIFITNILH